MKNLVPACLLLFVFSCKKTEQPTTTNPPSTTNITKSWLALGDSYTIGESVGYGERFPLQTASLLQQQGVNIQPLDFIAVTGWTTEDLKLAISNSNPSPHDVVTLLIGVNDQYQRHDTTGYRQRFTDLLSTGISLAGNKKNHVFVLSIPDYSVTPFAANSDTAQIRREIDLFNNINKEVTLTTGIAYINITPGSKQGRNNRALIASDGLHPSGLEYKKWADALAPLVLAVLK